MMLRRILKKRRVTTRKKTGTAKKRVKRRPVITLKLGPEPPDDSRFSQEYKDYITSEEWQVKRKIALRAAKHRCQLCYSPFNLHVHHRTYKRFTDEDPSDLTVLCKECHDLFHKYRHVYQE